MAWQKKGDPRVLADHFGKKLQVQDYEDTVTGDTKDIGVFTPNPGGFCVLAVTGNGKVFLTTDMKFGIGEVTTWIGGGRAKDGDTEAGARDFMKKLGCTGGTLTYLGEVPYIPGDCTGYQRYWLALGCVAAERLPENVTLVDFSEFISDVQKGGHRNPFTIVALALSLQHIGLTICLRT